MKICIAFCIIYRIVYDEYQTLVGLGLYRLAVAARHVGALRRESPCRLGLRIRVNDCARSANGRSPSFERLAIRVWDGGGRRTGHPCSAWVRPEASR